MCTKRRGTCCKGAENVLRLKYEDFASFHTQEEARERVMGMLERRLLVSLGMLMLPVLCFTRTSSKGKLCGKGTLNFHMNHVSYARGVYFVKRLHVEHRLLAHSDMWPAVFITEKFMLRLFSLSATCVRAAISLLAMFYCIRGYRVNSQQHPHELMKRYIGTLRFMLSSGA